VWKTLVRLRRLDSELTGREFIAADRYTIADITAQVALDLFTSLAHQPFSSELPNVTGTMPSLPAPTRGHDHRAIGLCLLAAGGFRDLDFAGMRSRFPRRLGTVC
jgi:hypothetical protein